MDPEKTDLERVEDDLIAHLKGKLADGSIRSMDSKLLLELLSQRAANAPRKGPPLDTLQDDLPFQTEDRVVM